jgi:hypothetical protein
VTGGGFGRVLRVGGVGEWMEKGRIVLHKSLSGVDFWIDTRRRSAIDRQ